MTRIRELSPMQWVRVLRDKNKMTVYGLAKAIGTTPQRIDKLESSAQGCKMDVLCALRKVFGLTWEQLGKLIEAEAGSMVPRPYRPQKPRKLKKLE